MHSALALFKRVIWRIPRGTRRNSFGLLVMLELTLILFIGSRFIAPFTNFDDTKAPGGREFEGNGGWIFVGINSLRDHFELPLWNPYFGTGIPYIADPLSHFFSPLALFPALFLGADDGPRLAVPLTIIAAGLGQYYLGHTLGLSSPARVLGALVYMMNGQMLARFEFGHFDFGLAYPYLPLCVAFLVKCMTTNRGTLYPILGGASLAGLLFAGNLYYFVFFLPGLIMITLIYAIDVRFGERPRIHMRAIGRAAAMAAFAVGFSAIQWVPWYAISGDVYKPSDPNLIGSPTVLGSLRALFTGDSTYSRSGADGMVAGYPFEYYAYIGAMLIPLFILSPLALLTSRRRAYLVAVALFWVYILWASAAHTLFKYLYESYGRLYDFRWTSRQIALALPFAALIASLGVDAVWRLVRSGTRSLPANRRRILAPAVSTAALVIIAVFGWYAVKDLYNINRLHYHFVIRPANGQQVVTQLAQDLDRPFFFDQQWVGLGGVRYPFYDLNMVKRSRVSWGWEFSGNEGVILPEKARIRLLPAPRYISQPGDYPAPPSSTLVADLQGTLLYKRTDAPPYSGFVTRAEAATRPDSLIHGAEFPGGFAPWPWTQITETEASWPTTNQVRVQGAPTAGQDTLLVLESFDKGWRMEIDGRRAGKPENIGGLIGTKAQPGQHTYLFVFDPAYARRGVAITVGTILGAALLMLQSPATYLIHRARRRISGSPGARTV